MRKGSLFFSVVFSFVMLVFVFFLIWHIPSRANLNFQLADTEISLDTSHGRERKQQTEYDQVVAQLPLTQAELEEAQPLADEAVAKVAALKKERSALREEKKRLEEMLAGQSSDGTKEDSDHE